MPLNSYGPLQQSQYAHKNMETDKYILLLSVHVSYPRSDGILRTKAKVVPLGTSFEWRHGLDDGLIYNTSQHKLHGDSVFGTVPSAAFRTTWLSRGSIYDMARAAIVVTVKWRGGGDQPSGGNFAFIQMSTKLERLAPRYVMLCIGGN
jgi:hypothetical protein